MSEIRKIDKSLDTAASAEERNHLAREILAELSAEWKVDGDSVEIKAFSEGITNTMLKAKRVGPDISSAQSEKSAVVLRAFGDEGVLADREKEITTHALFSSYGLAPKLLARFNNGVIYNFQPGQSSSMDQMRDPQVYRAVARTLGKWHAILPIIKTSSEIVDAAEAEEDVQPNIWTHMKDWCKDLPSSTDHEKSRKAILEHEVRRSENDVGSVSGWAGRKYVMGHCDLLCGNLIIENPDQLSQHSDEPVTVNFVDYELAAPVPAAFDIALHFGEWAGFDSDYNLTPSRSVRHEFVREYVASYFEHRPQDDKHRPANKQEEAKMVEELMQQVDLFRGMPGLFLGVWGSMKARKSSKEFDYETYAKVRLGEYWAARGELEGKDVGPGGKSDPEFREEKWMS